MSKFLTTIAALLALTIASGAQEVPYHVGIDDELVSRAQNNDKAVYLHQLPKTKWRVERPRSYPFTQRLDMSEGFGLSFGRTKAAINVKDDYPPYGR
jgi:hypothetical protein